LPVPAVCVFCASSEAIEPRYLDLAAEVGAELARRGHRLVSGGGRVSCMGAVARAARAGGAHTLGVIPRALVELEVADRDADELVVTEDMRSRKHEMDRRSDGFLALPAGLGTLEEMLEIWVSRTLGLHTKPLVVLHPGDFYGPLRIQVGRFLEGGFVRPAALDAIAWASTVPEAFDLLEAGWSEPGPVNLPSVEDVLESEP
jgi:uncharacterized protein (TIGR00730 family)